MSEEARKAFERVIARRGEPEAFAIDGYSGFLFVNEIGEPYPAHHYQESDLFYEKGVSGYKVSAQR